MGRSGALSAVEAVERKATSQRALAELIGAEFRAALAEYAGDEPEPDERTNAADELVYGAPPSAGSDYRYTVSGIAPVLPLSVYCRVTTSAAVANRNVAVEYRTGDGARFVLAGSAVTIPANSRQAFCWFPEAQAGWPVEDAALAALPSQWLAYGQALAITVYNGDAADLIDQVRIVLRPPKVS